MQDKTAPQLSVCGAAECCRMTIFTGGFSMENIRIYEEDGYIHFIMRPEDLMRLRYSTEAKTPFADFMDRWLTQMKTQVRENPRHTSADRRTRCGADHTLPPAQTPPLPVTAAPLPEKY